MYDLLTAILTAGWVNERCGRFNIFSIVSHFFMPLTMPRNAQVLPTAVDTFLF